MMRTVIHKGNNDHLIILLHGTGGSAESLFNLGEYLDKEATYVGIEGEILENGMRRYFERYADGSFKLKSLAKETQKLHTTILKVLKENTHKPVTILGYSNGANIALNMLKEYENLPFDYALLYHPSPVRAELPYQKQETLKVLLTSGHNDPFISEKEFKQLVEDLQDKMHVESCTHDHGHQLIKEELDVTKEFLGDLNV